MGGHASIVVGCNLDAQTQGAESLNDAQTDQKVMKRATHHSKKVR